MSKKNTSSLQWGLFGTGSIARTFADAVMQSKSNRLCAVASRSEERAQAFADKFDVSNAYGAYDALLANSDVDAVYIATHHPQHCEWAVKAMQAGKHVLCEKPAGLNSAEAEAMVEAARSNKVLFMEAFMYRCTPQTKKLVELVQQKVIGDLQLIEAAFCFDSGVNPEGRWQSKELGGGAILDVGCYTMSMARLLAGVAIGKSFAEPDSIQASGELFKTTGVDRLAEATLHFEGGIVAQLLTSLSMEHANQVVITGTAGTLTVTSPWFCQGEIILERKGTDAETLTFDSGKDLYVHEVDAFAATVAAGKLESESMSLEDTLGNMRALDIWREQVGVVYEVDK